MAIHFFSFGVQTHPRQSQFHLFYLQVTLDFKDIRSPGIFFQLGHISEFMVKSTGVLTWVAPEVFRFRAARLMGLIGTRDEAPIPDCMRLELWPDQMSGARVTAFGLNLPVGRWKKGF